MNQDYEKFRMQKVHAKSRGLEFLLTFDDWLNWWKSTGHYHERGKGALDYCMCRKGDKGGYSLDNVYCATNKQNAMDSVLNGRKIGTGFKGKNHTPEARALISIAVNKRISEEVIASRIKIYNEMNMNERGSLNKYAESIGLSHTSARRFINKHIISN